MIIVQSKSYEIPFGICSKRISRPDFLWRRDSASSGAGLSEVSKQRLGLCARNRSLSCATCMANKACHHENDARTARVTASSTTMLRAKSVEGSMSPMLTVVNVVRLK